MKSLKIILLFDLLVDLKPDDYKEYWGNPDWKTEKDVKTALTKLGHEVIPLGIFNDIEPFVELIKANKPDLVFNLSEAFAANRDFEPNIVALLEMLQVPFTGAGHKSLLLCKDKGLTKIILNHHEIKTPEFLVFERSRAFPSLINFKYPAFIKPLQLESSEGISQVSYAENEKDVLTRVEFIHEKLGADAIVEEFIDGREIYMSVIGNDKLSVFPPREMFFKQVPEDEPKFATYKSKWDKDYRKKWGIDSGWADEISEDLIKKLTTVSKKIYRTLEIKGFGRIDFRIRDQDIYFIEANPNPSIGIEEDYALSAHKSGMTYDELIAKIISLSIKT